jgi:hypothetical protein
MTDLSTLENRLRRLEDLEAIRNLMHAYAYGANIIGGPGDLKAFATLFVEDAEWDVGMGVFRGPAAIEARMREITIQWKAALHLMIDPLIELDGDQARGTFTGLFPLVPKDQSRPMWMASIYHNTFIRTPQGWRFKRVRTSLVFQPPEFDEVYSEIPPANR